MWRNEYPGNGKPGGIEASSITARIGSVERIYQRASTEVYTLVGPP